MIFLVDSSIYIFRAWQSLPGSIRNEFDEQANAVYGFADTLAHIASSYKPSHMLCAFDQSYATGKRYQIFPEYKANRPPAPPELEIQFARCREVAKAMGFTGFGSPLIEADDIIGMVAKSAHEAKQNVTIVSADKDLAQFIRPGDIYWNLGKKLRSEYSDLEKRFKLKPEQIADMLALCGDKVDNIPGVPGVGQTIAARVLKKWGSIDNALANLEGVAEMGFRGATRVAMLIHEHKSDIALARQLTGLIEDPAIPTNLDAYQRKVLDADTVAQSLVSIGFNEARAGKVGHTLANSYE